MTAHPRRGGVGEGQVRGVEEGLGVTEVADALRRLERDAQLGREDVDRLAVVPRRALDR